MSRFVLAAALLLVVAGCEDFDEAFEPEGTPPPGDAYVEVRLTEYEIEIPDSAPAGELSFEITNDGSLDHSFVIEGEDVEYALEDPLRPTVTEVLTVELEPGTYTVYCPIGDHREQGMEEQIEITEAEGTDDGAPLDDAVFPSDQMEEIDN